MQDEVRHQAPPPGAPARLNVGIVGAGPRGLSVLDRLCANERLARSGRPVTVHVIDPHPPGAGGVWRTDQPAQLLMNTVACQITVYTDESCAIDGPVESGPSLYEWARELALLGEFAGHDEEGVAEVRRLGPDDYPTRALFGRYLRSCFERITAAASDRFEVRVHPSRAMAMADVHGAPGGPQGLRLADGTRLNDLEAIVLAQGHVPERITARQARNASLARIHHLTYIPPANPADVELDTIAPGAPVLLRGLGLNFFDYAALLTEGRGGCFEERGDDLVYRPSGEEPVLYAFSRRAVPYHARGRNEKGSSGRYHPRLLTADAVAGLRRAAPHGLDFATDLWPLIAREVETVYYETLLRRFGRETDAGEFGERYLHAGRHHLPGLLDEYGVGQDDRWSWERLMRPCAGRTFGDRAAFRSWMLDHLRRDAAAAEQGNVSGPLKAALDVLRDLRNEVRLAVDHSGLHGHSYRDDLQGWYTPLNAYLSIGPPASRIRELVALIEAGVVEITGPGTQVRFDPSQPGFVASSREVPGAPVRSPALIEARLPEPDLRRTDDALLRHLLESDQITPYRIPAGDGAASYETGGLAVTERPYRIVDGRGRAHPRRFAFGVPTESVHWVTAAGIRPGVDSVTLGDSDAIARAVLDLEPLTRSVDAVPRVHADAATEVIV